MPDFTQWNVPSPFPNILYNPAAVDAAIAKTQSELGNLDIERKKFGLEQAKFDRGVTEGEGYIGGSLSGTTGTTGASGASVGPLADAAPDQSRDAAGQASYNFWVGKGLAPHQAAGMAAQEVAESGGRAHVVGDGGAAIGAYQHHPDRRALILAKTGIDMTKPDINAQREGAYWELMNAEHGARKLLFAATDPDQAGRAATEFERPDSKRRAIIDAERGRDARRIFQLANPNGAAGVATASVDPRAGPRVGLTPPPAVATAPPTAPGVNPNAAVQIPPPAVDPNARVEADDPNTAAVKQASAALLNMPEPDAAAAYPAVVRELQARGFAMNAPSTYPGHAALQALVGGGEPAVAQTKTAMRLGGTDVAGPPGVVPAPPDPAPNRMAYGTNLPGVTIGMPGNGLAPPPTAVAPSPVQTAAAPAPAQPQAASPQTQPPPAPSRVIQREPLLSNNLTASQQDAARRAIRAGTPLATVQAHVEQWKQENVAARHQDAVDAAAEQEANYQRGQKAEQTTYDRTEKAKADAIAAAQEKRAADKAAAEASDILKDKEENARIERTLLTIGPKVRAGIQLTPEEDAEYSLRWNKYRAGPIQEIPDGKGGFFKANVPREMPPQFPPPPGQTVAPGPQAIPGTERQPEMAPATVVGGMLANGIGQRKIMTALAGLEAHPDAVGLKANAPNWLLQRTDPEGESLRAAVSNVGGHEFHELSGAAVQMSEAKRLKYIPSDTDSATTLKTKLHQMLDDNRAALLQSYRTYGPEGNFRRSVAIEEAIIDSIPQVSIDSLKAKPETARDFDKAFGKGAAKLVLQHD